MENIKINYGTSYISNSLSGTSFELNNTNDIILNNTNDIILNNTNDIILNNTNGIITINNSLNVGTYNISINYINNFKDKPMLLL